MLTMLDDNYPTVQQRTAIAALSGVGLATVNRAYRRRRCQRGTLVRIAEAARRLGLAVPAAAEGLSFAPLPTSTHSCARCGNCLLEFYATRERLVK